MRQSTNFILKETVTRLAAGLFCAGLLACGGGSGAASEASGNGRVMLASAEMSRSPSGTAVQSSPTPAQMQAIARYASTSADPTKARFNGPQGIKLCNTGDLYIADARNYTIRRITPSGVVSTFAGMPGVRGSVDGTGPGALFTEPRGLALDSAGNVYVTDGSVVRKIAPSRAVTTIAGLQGAFGEADGAGAAARFHTPDGIVVDGAGNLFVADNDISALTIRKITRAGTVSTFAGGNSGGVTEIPHDDIGTKARFVGPVGLAIDRWNNLYVTDVGMGGLTAPNLYDGSSFVRKVTPGAVVTTIAGNFGFTSLPAGGPLAEFATSSGIVVDQFGNIFVVDHFDHGNRIKKITPSGTISILATDPTKFGLLSGMMVDYANNLYVTDINNDTIGKITPSGSYTVYAGKAGESGSANTP